MVHPCCGRSLQRGTKLIAMSQVITAVATMCLILVGGVAVAIVNIFGQGASITPGLSPKTSFSGNLSNFVKNVIYTPHHHLLVQIGFMTFAVSIVSLVSGIMLMNGANRRQAWKCRASSVFRVVLDILGFFAMGTFIFSFKEEIFHYFQIEDWLPYLIGACLGEMYYFWVITAFITEVAKEQKYKRAVALGDRVYYTNV